MATFKTQVVSETENGAVSLAVQHLAAGNLVAIPTETVYGLAADATEYSAVQQIYEAKGRPSFNPLICHVADIEMAKKIVTVSPLAAKLMEIYWPGPLTLVLPARPDSPIAAPVSAGLDTLAVRCPKKAVTREIIKELGRPIAAPSANPSGKLSPTCAADVLAGLDGKLPLIIDAGDAPEGIESTIIGVKDEKLYLLRPGTITADEIAEQTGQPVLDRNEDEISAPGQLLSHYAPEASVRLNATEKQDAELLIGFGDIAGDISLSASGNLSEAAHNLFKTLRNADKSSTHIAVAPIPNHGIGIAINDRLKRAAAPRKEA
ncbi:L-threonylcarbamoyladenylate synthase [Kordiimonas lipolytica]|uniref:Threonylcarbamoyl-AMP synthase n=1 Tax=Kordiimonas lipolytica TaxID=1662421 RepID=A0ABV8UC64_9PROT|nr:L-threonylcarbamoyladenylate synthase [Kordiimonas lipolytica]